MVQPTVAPDPSALRPRGDRRAWIGVAALSVLTVVAVMIAVAVISLETHFDCGGTFGGPGAGADADLDRECVGGRGWKAPIALLAIAGSSVVAWKVIRRGERLPADHEVAEESEGRSRVLRRARAAAIVMLLIVAWIVGVTLFVKL